MLFSPLFCSLGITTSECSMGALTPRRHGVAGQQQPKSIQCATRPGRWAPPTGLLLPSRRGADATASACKGEEDTETAKTPRARTPDPGLGAQRKCRGKKQDTGEVDGWTR